MYLFSSHGPFSSPRTDRDCPKRLKKLGPWLNRHDLLSAIKFHAFVAFLSWEVSQYCQTGRPRPMFYPSGPFSVFFSPYIYSIYSQTIHGLSGPLWRHSLFAWVQFLEKLSTLTKQTNKQTKTDVSVVKNLPFPWFPLE